MPVCVTQISAKKKKKKGLQVYTQNIYNKREQTLGSSHTSTVKSNILCSLVCCTFALISG